MDLLRQWYASQAYLQELGQLCTLNSLRKYLGRAILYAVSPKQRAFVGSPLSLNSSGVSYANEQETARVWVERGSDRISSVLPPRRRQHPASPSLKTTLDSISDTTIPRVRKVGRRLSGVNLALNVERPRTSVAAPVHPSTSSSFAPSPFSPVDPLRPILSPSAHSTPSLPLLFSSAFAPKIALLETWLLTSDTAASSLPPHSADLARARAHGVRFIMSEEKHELEYDARRGTARKDGTVKVRTGAVVSTCDASEEEEVRRLRWEKRITARLEEYVGHQNSPLTAPPTTVQYISKGLRDALSATAMSYLAEDTSSSSASSLSTHSDPQPLLVDLPSLRAVLSSPQPPLSPHRERLKRNYASSRPRRPERSQLRDPLLRRRHDKQQMDTLDDCMLDARIQSMGRARSAPRLFVADRDGFSQPPSGRIDVGKRWHSSVLGVIPALPSLRYSTFETAVVSRTSTVFGATKGKDSAVAFSPLRASTMPPTPSSTSTRTSATRSTFSPPQLYRHSPLPPPSPSPLPLPPLPSASHAPAAPGGPLSLVYIKNA